MSIFNLKTSPEELKSSNDGISSFNYNEYTPSRDVSGTNFPQGRFVIPWELNSESWWIPSRSYMRIRCNLTKGDGTQLTLSNKIAPNMNLAANLFQSMELQLNGKTISRCSDNVAQVDTLEQRLHQSKSWMDSIGASINWLQESVDDRINEVSSNGYANTNEMKFITDWTDPSFGLATGLVGVLTNQVELKLDTVDASSGDTFITLTHSTTPLTQANVDAINAKLKPGDYIVFNNGDAQVAARCYVSIKNNGIAFLDTAKVLIRCTFGPERSVGVAAPLLTLIDSQFEIRRPAPSRRISGFEVIWKPMCLSVFKYAGALPVGKYELICTPHNASGNNYKIRSIETPQYVQKANIPAFGTTATNIKFEVDSCRFYVAQVVGERVEDMTYYLDLETTRLQTAQMLATTSLAKEYFNVSPLTYALTVAYQSIDAGIDSRYSASRFTVGDIVDEKTGVVSLEDPELKLNRLFVQYAGKSFPQPDADPSYKVGDAKYYTTQRYVETQINCGSYFCEGGGESLYEWQKRGSLHYFSCPKDGQDRSTRATVNHQFASDFSNKARILLFDHASMSCKITIQRGLVVSVELIDA